MPVSNRLDPEEALAGPLYLVAFVLILIPAVDFLLSIPPAELGSVQWRFAAVGLLSGYTLTPILGLALALVVSAVLKHHNVQRLLVILCLTIALALIGLSLGFVLDVLQIRASVAEDGRPAFNSAWMRAVIKHALSAVALGYLGWRARRMIPARTRHRAPKTVHVVSK
jgi:hypothetical protein